MESELEKKVKRWDNEGCVPVIPILAVIAGTVASLLAYGDASGRVSYARTEEKSGIGPCFDCRGGSNNPTPDKKFPPGCSGCPYKPSIW